MQKKSEQLALKIKQAQRETGIILAHFAWINTATNMEYLLQIERDVHHYLSEMGLHFTIFQKMLLINELNRMKKLFR